MGKKLRDPCSPKPPVNSYLEFAHEVRERIVLDAGGSLSSAEIAKEIGSRWRKLSGEEKKKYEKRYSDNKEKYLKLRADQAEKTNTTEIEALVAPTPTKPKKKKKRDVLAPKLPLSSFMEFGKVERPKILAELGGISLTEVGRELGNRWRSLSNEEKKVFEDKSKENKLKYQKEKASLEQKRLSDNLASPDNFVPPLQEEVQPESSPGTSPPLSSSQSDSRPITENDLGFAQQKKFPWHPALKTGTLANGSRIRVTLFGTGETITVDKSKWVVFSDRSENRIKTQSRMRNAAFRKGLDQMKSLWEKVQRESDIPSSSSGIEFTPRIGGRKFRALNKDALQKEEAENLLQMEKKMRQEVGSKLWTCKDCSWKGFFRHKAKAHARSCGQRKRENIKQFKKKKFHCSSENCEMSFNMKSKLVAHYKSVHVNANQVYSCIPCRKTFTVWRNFRRHNQEKHEDVGKFCCSDCKFKTNRMETLRRHKKARHQSHEVVRNLLGQLIDQVVECMKDGDSNDIVVALLDDVVSEVVAHDVDPDDEVEPDDEFESVDNVDVGVSEISAYEKARNDWVAHVRNEFHRQFPSFMKDLNALKNVKKTRKRNQTQGQASSAPLRKSSRILFNRPGIDCNGGTIREGGDDANVGKDVMEATTEIKETEVVFNAGSVIPIDEVEEPEVDPVPGADQEPCYEGLGKFACLPCRKPFR